MSAGASTATPCGSSPSRATNVTAARFKARVAEVRTQLRTETAGIRTEIADLETRLIRWMVGTAPSMPAGITPRVARKRRNVGAAVTGLRRTDGPSRLARVYTNAAIVGTVSRNQPGVGVPAHSARRVAALRRYIRRVPTTRPCTCTR